MTFFFLMLAGCSLVPAADASPVPDDAVEDGLDIFELSRADVRGTRQAIAMIAQTVDALSPAERAEAAASLRFLVANCPYTRSALMLPIALDAAVSDTDIGRPVAYARWDWGFLQEGLAIHVAVLDALEVALPAPAPGDALYGHPAAISREAVLAADDPIAAVAPMVDSIVEIAAQIDGPTADAIARHSARVEHLTGIVRPCPRGPWSVMPGQPWTLGLQLGGWHDALRRIEPTVDAPAIEEMIAVMDAYDEAFHASAVRTPSRRR